MPTLLAQGALNAQLGALEGRRAPQGSGGGGGSGRNADQAAQSSGLSGVNSSQSVRIVAPGVPDNFGSGPGPSNRNPNDTIVDGAEQRQPGRADDDRAVQDVRQQQPCNRRQRRQQPLPTQPLPTPPLPPPPTQVPTVGQRNAQPTGRRQPPSQPAADGNCDICWRHGRYRERPSDRHRQLSERVELRPERRNRHRELPGGELPGRHSRWPRRDVFNSHGNPVEQSTHRKLELNGIFFGSGSQPAYQFGNFNITSTNSGNYSAIRRLRRRKALASGAAGRR